MRRGRISGPVNRLLEGKMQDWQSKAEKLERTIQWLIIERTRLMSRVSHLESERDAAIWLRENDISSDVSESLMANLADLDDIEVGHTPLDEGH